MAPPLASCRRLLHAVSTLTPLAATLLGFFAAPAAAAGLRKGPYLLFADDPTQMSVLWQANATPSIGATLEWGLSTSYGLGSVAPSESGTSYDQHQFEHAITGLTPGVRYFYRVTVDGEVVESSFLAAPEPSVTRLTFYAFGDTRSNPDYFNEVSQHLLADMDMAADVQQTLVLHSGDWVAEGDVEADWDNQFFDRTQPAPLELVARVPVLGCRGNHERDGSLLKKYWPFAYEVSSGGASYFSFDYGPLHVAVVDQEIAFDQGSAQHDWLEQDLAAAAAPWLFVVLHKPPYSAGGSHGDHEETKAELVPLFDTYDVDFVVAGHNHHYARCVVNGIQYVTTGGGGAGLTGVDASLPYVQVAESVRHFTKFEIDGARLTYTAVRGDGSVIETLEIDKGPDTTPPTVVAVLAEGDPTRALVTFSETVEAGAGLNGAENPANYALTSLGVTAANLEVGGRRAALNVSPPLGTGVSYTLTVSDVADRAPIPNVMPRPQAITFEFTPAPPEPEVLVAVGDVWRYLKGLSYPGDDWYLPAHDDGAWAEGSTGIGYGDGDDATVLDDMRDSYLTVYMRRAFTVADPAAVSSLTLTVDYDDGFVAFINGAEVARRNVPAGQDHQTEASSHEADAPEEIGLDAAIGELVAGENLLAIEVHNTSLGSSDLSMIPELAAVLRPVAPDAGGQADAAPTPDAAVTVDSAAPADAGPPADAFARDTATADQLAAADSGGLSDAGQAADAGSAPDLAVSVDASVLPDAAAGRDTSAGEGDAVVEPGDAAAAADASAPPIGSGEGTGTRTRVGSGCSCRSSGARAVATPLALCLFALAWRRGRGCSLRLRSFTRH